MYLYSLTLQKAGGITSAVCGNFSGAKEQEIVVGRGKVLEILRLDTSGKLRSLYSVEIFGVIRSLAQFRLTGAQKDLLIVGSDSGRIVILEYSKEKNSFERIHQETYGKSGCRRIVPGQYLAVDPKGRACMIGAIEKQKLVYVLNRDAAAHLTISSPLEAHKSHTIVYSVVAVDCGFDNPIFAAIELDYGDADQDPSGQSAAEAEKQLTFYELDLGLNHVVRKWAEPVDAGSNMLIQVPGGADGPSGVLVCAENFVIYKNQGHADVRAIIPRRQDLPAERGVLIVAAAVHRQKNMFFFLVQTEYGDIFKVTLDYAEEQVSEVKLTYFDTIPTTSAMCVLRKGFLFAASEFGNHNLYKFVGLGDDAEVESSSTQTEETEDGWKPTIFYHPRKLRNLVDIDEMESLMPITDMKVATLPDQETPHIFALCGRGSRSTLRALKPGLTVQEMAVSDLPSAATAVWTVRRKATDEFDAYIIVSFANATLVLSVGETVQEVNDSGFLGTTPTLAASLLGEDSLMQVHPGGIRHIRADGRINEWKTPGKKSIVKVGYNRLQVVIALSGGELIYFEMDITGQLQEIEKREMSGDVACLDIAPVPEGRQRSKFLAVGSYDNTIRILLLDPEDCLSIQGTQSVATAPESLLLLEVGGSHSGADGVDRPASLFLNAGLQSGVLLRTEVDMVTGQLSDTRTRFLGLKPPKLFSIRIRGKQAMLALTTRTWLGYALHGHFFLTPLSYQLLEHAAAFSSDACPEGVVAVEGVSLRVFNIEKLGEGFDQRTVPLRYTPRKFILHPKFPSLFVIEADQGTFSADEFAAMRQEAIEATGADTGAGAGAGAERDEDAMEEDEGEGEEEKEDPLPVAQYGFPKSVPTKWASCIRAVDPASLATTCLLELGESEAAICLCHVTFQNQPPMLAVGTAKSMQFWPKRTAEMGFIHMYAVTEEGKSLELVHKTTMEGVPTALCAFQGRLLVGVGNVLRIYDLGRRKLLRKCENKMFPNTIVSIHTYGDRIYVGDIQESFHFVKYRRDENQLYIFADDISPRWLTSSLHIDFDTMAGGDKFGNVYMARLPVEISEEIEEDPTGGKIKWESGRLNGAPNKVDQVVQFHVGDVVTCLQKAALVAGQTESVLYGTSMGSIGALMPFTSREDVDFFSHLEMHLRQEHAPLCGRDHMMFRSYYFPVKDVVDGDLCEQFSSITLDMQKKIAGELDRTPGEVMKKLEDMRNRIL